ncbi:unnamed protein product, partial [Scytosiphon promiscuus]
GEAFDSLGLRLDVDLRLSDKTNHRPIFVVLRWLEGRCSCLPACKVDFESSCLIFVLLKRSPFHTCVWKFSSVACVVCKKYRRPLLDVASCSTRFEISECAVFAHFNMKRDDKRSSLDYGSVRCPSRGHRLHPFLRFAWVNTEVDSVQTGFLLDIGTSRHGFSSSRKNPVGVCRPSAVL